jgi:hypothetical protein
MQSGALAVQPCGWLSSVSAKDFRRRHGRMVSPVAVTANATATGARFLELDGSRGLSRTLVVRGAKQLTKLHTVTDVPTVALLADSLTLQPIKKIDGVVRHVTW